MSVNQGLLKIGEVHTLLRKDFPDIELSKIRYYEDKGLVQPSRSRKGYRLYSDKDVETLREAIRLAQEEFVPLRVVRLRLIDKGLLKDTPVAGATRKAARTSLAPSVTATIAPIVRPVETESSVTELRTSPSHHSFSWDEVLHLSKISSAILTQLQSLGLVSASSNRNDSSFTQGDVQIATLATSLIERGVDVRLLGSLRRVAEREIGLIDDITAPLRSPANKLNDEQAKELTMEVANDVMAMRGLLFHRAFSDYLSN